MLLRNISYEIQKQVRELFGQTNVVVNDLRSYKSSKILHNRRYTVYEFSKQGISHKT